MGRHGMCTTPGMTSPNGKPTLKTWAARVRMRIGALLNGLGVPGAIRTSPCETRLDVPVEVRVGPLFTVVTVKNVRVFFHRISGRFDGVAIAETDCLDSR
jgi:hypothetical protein